MKNHFRVRRQLLAALGLSTVAALLSAQEVTHQSDAAALAPLLAWAQGLEGAVGSFEQVQEQRAGQRLHLTGYFAYRKPLRFRWEVTHPFAHVTVSDGETITIWDPDLGQATRTAVVAEALTDGPLGFLLVPHRMAQSFTLKRVVREHEESRWLLQARIRHAVMDQLEVVLVGDRLVAVVVTDPLGQQSRVHFTQFERRLPPIETFRLVLPPTAVIVDLPRRDGP